MGFVVAAGVFLAFVALVVWLDAGRPALSRTTRGGRRRPPGRPTVSSEVVQQHSLSPAEMAQVQDAVLRGRALTDQRLRAATVAVARQHLAERTAWAAAQPPWPGALVLLVVTVVTGAVAFGVFRVVTGGDLSVNWLHLAGWGVSLALGWRRRSAPARAVTLNQERAG